MHFSASSQRTKCKRGSGLPPAFRTASDTSCMGVEAWLNIYSMHSIIHQPVNVTVT